MVEDDPIYRIEMTLRDPCRITSLLVPDLSVSNPFNLLRADIWRCSLLDKLLMQCAPN